MKSVLISIKPKYVELIANGEKTIEVRKSAPKEVPVKAYIYETKGATEIPWVDEDGHFIYKGRGQVIGEFVCDRIEMVNSSCSAYGIDLFYHDCMTQGCLAERDIEKYFNIPKDKDLRVMKGNGYAWHIFDLKIYDKPKSIMQFYKPCPDKFHCCEICKYGSVVLSPDEEEYALYHGGNYDTYETVCRNIVTRPPQSYMYVEEL